MTDSQNLLTEYVRTGSDAAFRELVTRYVDLVYRTALRLVDGDSHRAEDVAQTVFIDLARTARTLSGKVMLGGWLHRHTCFVVANTLRGERRRLVREKQAVEMNALQDRSEADVSRVVPLLDEAINELGETDRTAIVLRFFEERDFPSVGQALGSSEEAARKRVNRALDKLQTLLKRRGLTTTAAALSVVLSASTAPAVPAGLAATIAATALNGAAFATTATLSAAQTIAMTTLQKTIIGATLTVAIGTAVFEGHQASTRQTEVQALQQQQAPLTEQVQQLRQALDAATLQVSGLREENERLNRDTSELLALRGETVRLRALQLQRVQSGLSGQWTNDPFVQGVLALTARAAELNQYLTQMPDKRIPELQFVREDDWLNAAKDAQLQSDTGIRTALSKLRSLAKTKFAPHISQALDKYIEANNGELPAAASDLQPFFAVPIPEGILERYQVLHSGNVKDLAKDAWILSEKAPVDKECDSHLYVGANGRSGSYGTGLGSVGDPDPSWPNATNRLSRTP